MNLNHTCVEESAKHVFNSSFPEIHDVLSFMRMFPQLSDLFSNDLYKIHDEIVNAKTKLVDICKKMSFMMDNPNMIPLYQKGKLDCLKDQVRELVKGRELIKAVKLVRDTMGWDLKTSKAFVDEV